MIDSYSFGRISINGEQYSSDIIIYPDKVDSNWWRKQGHYLQLVDLEEVIENKPETIIVGTGNMGVMKVAPEVEKYLKENNITLIACKTEKACQIYNELSSKSRVVAAFHLTC